MTSDPVLALSVNLYQSGEFQSPLHGDSLNLPHATGILLEALSVTGPDAAGRQRQILEYYGPFADLPPGLSAGGS